MANYLISKNWDLTLGIRANRTETSCLIVSLKENILPTVAGPFNVKSNIDKTLAIGAWKDKGYRVKFFIYIFTLSNFDRWFYFISSTHCNSLILSERNKDGKNTKEYLVEAAHYYTKVGMGAVDRFNQMLKSHDWKHRNKSWRACHFQTLLRFIFVNSWVIYKFRNEGKVKYRTFLKLLQGELIAKFHEGESLKKKASKERRRTNQARYARERRLREKNSRLND